MKIDIVNCFCTTDSNFGNRAAVIRGFSGDKEQKQEITKELNLPVTVFVSNEDSEVPILEYFYPETEMALCLHGTLAASKVLFFERDVNTLEFLTAAGLLLKVNQYKNLIQVEVSQKISPEIGLDRSLICRMLNLTYEDILENELPFKVASVGSPKLLVPIKSKEILLSLNPDFFMIKKWSIENGVNGLYVYTPDSIENGFDFIARGFNPKTGNNEDAATGVAAAALSLCLQKSLVIDQGIMLGNTCKIITTYVSDSQIFVGGNVVIERTHEYDFLVTKYDSNRLGFF